ncbi:MAG: hypothetical protein ACYTGN_07155 [Planctomycetota bacterium]|jgi:hypothetical protein
MRTGVVDSLGIAGTGGTAVAWSERDVTFGLERLPWVFERPFKDFKRHDPLTQQACLAVEAMGGQFAPRTALVLATSRGCLDADLAFAASLATFPSPAVFPFTLPSTCLGVLAIRHGIVGPVLCLSTGPGGQGRAADEALRLLEFGDADSAVVVAGDPGESMVAGELRRGDTRLPTAEEIRA